MTTIINPQTNGENRTSGADIVLGIILTLVIITLFFLYVVPQFRPSTKAESDSINVNIKLPENEIPSPTVSNKVQ